MNTRQEVSAELDVRRDGDVDRQIYDGEIVDETTGPKRPIIDATVVVRQRGAAVITTVRSHGPTVRAAAAGVLVLKGFESWGKRAYDGSTMGTYRRAIRAAEAAGDREALGLWLDRKEKAADQRHKRLMDAPSLALSVVKGGVFALVGFAGLMLMLAVVAQVSGVGSFVGFLAGVLALIAFVAAVVAFLWTPLIAALPAFVLVAAYREGKRRGQTPGWAMTAVQRAEENVIVTPAGIAAALAHLGIPALSKAIKDGWQVEFSTPPVRVNDKGYQFVHSLPMGVTPDMIADKRAVYARNLFRQPLEVWPTAAERAGSLDMWVADQGATEKSAPPYPLLHEGTADFFSGIPLGVSQRGDVIQPPLMGANLVFGGLMGQGKSNAARVVMAGLALDPITELRAYVFAGNGDFDAYEPRLTRYERGTGDAVVVAAIQDLQELYAEVGRREERLAQLGAKKVTRGLVMQHPDLRPIFAMYSECHELFGHEEHGKMAADLAVQIMRRARKTAIALGFDTQSSRKDAIPPKIVELVSLNACFAVKAWRSNDGFLGDGSFQAGIRATELRSGRDRGTSVLTGATEERFELVKWFFIPVDDDAGTDAATDIIVRAMAALHPSVPVGEERPDPQAPRNLLEDLDEVLGSERVRIADVPALLRELAPDWTPYRVLNGTKLQTRLEDQYGVRVARTGNKNLLDPADVRAALARLATADLDDEG